MSTSPRIQIDDYSTFEITESNVGDLQYSQIDEIVKAKGDNLSDYEIYCLQNGWGNGAYSSSSGSQMSYIRDYCSEETLNYIESRDVSNYNPELNFYNADSSEKITQLLEERNYKLTDGELKDLYSNRYFSMTSGSPEMLSKTAIPRDYQVNDNVKTQWDLIQYRTNEEITSKYEGLLSSFTDDVGWSEKDGVKYYSAGFKTEVGYFAKCIQNIALANNQATTFQINESTTIEHPYSDCSWIQAYYPIQDIDYKSFQETAKGFNKQIADKTKTLFDTLDTIKRNLMLIDDDFRTAFNEEMKNWFDEQDFDGENKGSFFSSKAMLSLLYDARESGLYNSEELAVLDDVIAHTEYIQMDDIQKLFNGAGVFLVSLAGGFLKVGEQLVDGVLNLTADTVGKLAYLCTGDDSIIRTLDTIIAADATGALEDLALSGVNVYYMDNEGKVVRSLGEGAGEALGTVVLTCATAGTGTAYVIAGTTVTYLQVSGKTADSLLSDAMDAAGGSFDNVSTDKLLLLNDNANMKGATTATLRLIFQGAKVFDATGQEVTVGGWKSVIPWDNNAVKIAEKGVQTLVTDGVNYCYDTATVASAGVTDWTNPTKPLTNAEKKVFGEAINTYLNSLGLPKIDNKALSAVVGGDGAGYYSKAANLIKEATGVDVSVDAMASAVTKYVGTPQIITTANAEENDSSPARESNSLAAAIVTGQGTRAAEAPTEAPRTQNANEGFVASNTQKSSGITASSNGVYSFDNNNNNNEPTTTVPHTYYARNEDNSHFTVEEA